MWYSPVLLLPVNLMAIFFSNVFIYFLVMYFSSISTRVKVSNPLSSCLSCS